MISDRGRVRKERFAPGAFRHSILAATTQEVIGGISLGFRVPPAAAVANATDLVPERGNPDVMIRLIRAAILYEMILVTRPAYRGSAIDLRAEGGAGFCEAKARLWLSL